MASGWAGGGFEVEGDEATLVYRRRGHDGRVLEERRIAPGPAAWDRFKARLKELGVADWEDRYEPPYPVCGGESWAVRLDEKTSTGEDAFPPNWAGFWDALSELVGFRLE